MPLDCLYDAGVQSRSQPRLGLGFCSVGIRVQGRAHTWPLQCCIRWRSLPSTHWTWRCFSGSALLAQRRRAHRYVLRTILLTSQWQKKFSSMHFCWHLWCVLCKIMWCTFCQTFKLFIDREWRLLMSRFPKSPMMINGCCCPFRCPECIIVPWGMYLSGFDCVFILIQLFCEAKRTSPSILYIPHMQRWWDTVSSALRATFLSLLQDIPSFTPILLLATCSLPYHSLYTEVRVILTIRARTTAAPSRTDKN